MRTLLEIHYDEVHTERYLQRARERGGEDRKMTKIRKSEYKVFKSVVQGHRRQACQRIQLPQAYIYIYRITFTCGCLCS